MDRHDLKLFKGWVTHVRKEPSKHEFRYKYFQIWLDVEKPRLIDELSPFWSSQRPNLVRYKRQNYQPGGESIYATISEIIRKKTGRHFSGKIYLLGNLTHWGYCYNPVTFYFCYEQEKLQFILSEVHNTPWGERFTYLHVISESQSITPSHLENKKGDSFKVRSNKEFHVSPFMPMELDYQWKFKITDNEIFISIDLSEKSTSIFNATLFLSEQPLTPKNANLIALIYPFICFNVLFSIYWQAFRLWLKKVPFFIHPKKISK